MRTDGRLYVPVHTHPRRLDRPWSLPACLLLQGCFARLPWCKAMQCASPRWLCVRLGLSSLPQVSFEAAKSGAELWPASLRRSTLALARTTERTSQGGCHTWRLSDRWNVVLPYCQWGACLWRRLGAHYGLVSLGDRKAKNSTTVAVPDQRVGRRSHP